MFTDMKNVCDIIQWLFKDQRLIIIVIVIVIFWFDWFDTSWLILFLNVYVYLCIYVCDLWIESIFINQKTKTFFKNISPVIIITTTNHLFVCLFVIIEYLKKKRIRKTMMIIKCLFDKTKLYKEWSFVFILFCQKNVKNVTLHFKKSSSSYDYHPKKNLKV